MLVEIQTVPLSHQIQPQPCHVNRNSAISVSCQFRQKRVMFKWNSAISVFISNSKKRLSCLMRIQLLCFHARYNLNIVICHGIGNSANSVSCQIQPQHCHVSGNSAISVQPGSFSCQTHNKPASCNEISAIFTSMSKRPDSNFAHSCIRTPMQKFY